MGIADAQQAPALAIALVTYNRPAYLETLLESLVAQGSQVPYEFALLDNGSQYPLTADVRRLLEALPCKPTVLQERTNVVAWDRLRTLAAATSAPFILVPGDDDILLPNYLQTMQRLVDENPAARMLSTSCMTINSKGDPLGGRLEPPRYTSQPAALAAIISRASYPMPSSGFHRDLLAAGPVPRGRTTVDWWLWLQSWVDGPAAVSTEATVSYRVHAGQEQHHYGTEMKSLEAARMLIEFVTSDRFAGAARAWTADQHREFADTLMGGLGPSWGEPRWSSIIQVTLADVLAAWAPKDVVVDLFASGSARGGAIASVGTLNTLVAEQFVSALPSSTWSALDIAGTSSAECSVCSAWLKYLGLPERQGGEVKVSFACGCNGITGTTHSARALVSRGPSTVEVRLALVPTEATAAELLDVIGEAIGRAGGMSRPIGIEQAVLRLVRKARSVRLANQAVVWFRRARARRS